MADDIATPPVDPADPPKDSPEPQPGDAQETASLQRENDLQKALDAATASIAKLEKNNNEVLREKREAKDKAIQAANENKEFIKVAELQAEKLADYQTQLEEATGLKSENEQLIQKVAAQSEWSKQQVQIQLDSIPKDRVESLTKMPGWDTFTPENQLAQISHWVANQPADQRAPGGIGNHNGGQPTDEYAAMVKQGNARGFDLAQFAAAKRGK